MADRDFKGVWIPRCVWLDERLTMLDKGILTEIDSLDIGDDGCWASNDYLANFCQCSTSKITAAISKLSKLGYIQVESFDGRRRKIRSCLLKSNRQDNKKDGADYEKVRQSNIPINQTNNTENNTVSAKADDTDGFDKFWAVYPHKVKKQDAQKTWRSGKLGKIADTIIADVKLRCETEWKGQDIHYIPHPTTYLHQRRWEDDTKPTARKGHEEPVQRVYTDADYENDW